MDSLSLCKIKLTDIREFGCYFHGGLGKVHFICQQKQVITVGILTSTVEVDAPGEVCSVEREGRRGV